MANSPLLATVATGQHTITVNQLGPGYECVTPAVVSVGEADP